MNNNKYGVYKETESYRKVNGYNRYHYECLTDSTLLEVFDNLDDAIKYVDNHTLNVDKYSDSSLYADSLSVYEIENDNNYNYNDYEIISDSLYNKAYAYEELESMLDIKIVVY